LLEQKKIFQQKWNPTQLIALEIRTESFASTLPFAVNFVMTRPFCVLNKIHLFIRIPSNSLLS
jgi:hypothetical protein